MAAIRETQKPLLASPRRKIHDVTHRCPEYSSHVYDLYAFTITSVNSTTLEIQLIMPTEAVISPTGSYAISKTSREDEKAVKSWGFNHVFTWADGPYAILSPSPT